MGSDGGEASLRPRLHTVTVTSEQQHVDVEVRLEVDGQPAHGASTGSPTPLGTARAAAHATLAALDPRVEGVRFGLDTIVEGGSPGAPWVTVVVSVLTRTGVERLVGSALVEDGLPGAAVRATLQACNRRLGHLLVAGPPGPAVGGSAHGTGTGVGASDLTGIVAHQLRGPATTLVGYLELLHAHLDSLDEATRRAMLDRSLDGGHRLLGRLENLLAMARADRLSPVVRRERVTVQTALRQALADVPGADHDIEVRCPDDVVVHVDPDHLAQVVGNYVDNALRHGAPPVVVDVERDEDWVVVHVTDAGPGLDDDRLDSLFELPTDRPANGTAGNGLGLYVARLLAEANDGAVEIARAAPRGLRATLRMPAG